MKTITAREHELIISVMGEGLSATDSLAITYSLATGNGINDADNGSFSISGTSLKVGGSSLTAGTYLIYVAATDAAGNISNQAFTVTVVDAPSVSSIVRTGGASSTVSASASSVSYTVTFSESVTGVDTSDFSLTATGTAAGSIASVSGSGTTYTVNVNTLSGDGTLRLDLNSSGTGIQSGSSVAIASGYTSGSTYTLDHTAPAAPSTPDMTSGTDTGSSSSDNITSNTTPVFTGTAESGSTVTLYDTDGTTVVGIATATGGNWSITSSTLAEGTHTLTAKATDAAGNVSSASSGLSTTIDATSPVVTSVSVPSNGSYKAGQTLAFTVNTSEAVTVDTGGGTPRLALTIGSSTVYAPYASGSGTSALVFSYTVQAGDTDSNGITVGSLQSNGGTLKDTAGNSMDLTLNSVGSTVSVLVDTTAPTVSSVSVPANATYIAGQNLDFTVNFSEAVTVDTSGGTPRIALTIGSSTVYASYVSGSGTSTLVFRHTTAAGELDTDGIAVGALSANGATLRDAAGNDATLTLNSVGSTASVNVDAIAPTVTGVSSSTSNGTYKIGDTVTVTVSFSEPVTVTGVPQVTLETGAVDRAATYASGSGSNTLSFSYTAQSGDSSSDLDYASITALVLNGGTVRDASGNDAVLTLATPGAAGSLGANKNLVIDGIAPAVTSVAVPANATYNPGQNLDFTVNFSDAVTVDTTGGTPRLALTIGTTTVYANYLSGSGSTALAFRYAVQAADLDTDGIAVGTLGTNGGTLRDASGNDVLLALNSVGATAGVRVGQPPAPPLPPDSDSDGVTSSVENAVPSLGGTTTVPGDGNGDGIADGSQPAVTSVPFIKSSSPISAPGSTPSVYVTLVSHSVGGKVGATVGGTVSLENVKQLDAPANLPAGMSLPLGLISFTAKLASTTPIESFSLYVDASLGVTGYWKQDPHGVWVNLASEPYGGRMVMEGGRLRLDFLITDGGTFDADGVRNGSITDPGGAAIVPLSLVGYKPDLPADGFWF